MKLNIVSPQILAFGLLIISSISLQFCTKEHIPEKPVCFSEEVYPIILSNCTYSTCHDPYNHEQGLDLTTYEGILGIVHPGNYNSSKLYNSITGIGDQLMPPAPYKPLSDGQITLIARWIQDGAVNTTNCVSACDTTNATYHGKIVPILETNCLGCHTGAQIQGGNIDLSTYAHLKEQVDRGALLGSIKHEIGYSEMPKNGAPLSDCKINIIAQWILEGAQEN